MADTTAITLTAIIVGGLGGPFAVEWLAGRRDQRRFAHERRMRDEADLRQHLDRVGESLGASTRAAAEARAVVLQDGLVNSPRLRAAVEQLDAELLKFEKLVTPLVIRAGPKSKVANVCDDLDDFARKLRLEIDLALVIGGGDPDRIPQMDRFETILDMGDRIPDLRERFNEAAYERAGVAEP